MARWEEWGEGWLKEGYYVSFQKEGIAYYERIVQRDFAHYEYDWPETISALGRSGPFVPDDLELTRGYNELNKTNMIWQMIFGIKGQVYIYVELPTDTKRHGVPKKPWHSSVLREVAHFEEWMSPFKEPSFITEHFMMRPEAFRIDFEAYNPQSISMPDLRLNIFLSKMVTERIGTEAYTETGLQLLSTRTRFDEILKKLHQRLVACRPLTILPVFAPAVAPAGE